MSLDNILKKIAADAQAQRQLIIEDAQKKAAEIIAQAEQQGKQQAESYLNETVREAELEAHRLVTQARLQHKLRALTMKRALVDQVLEQAFKAQEQEMRSLKRTVVLKDGEKEEAFDETQLLDELRPLLEDYIAGLLKI
jgi:vacuolar-type H+-ATPase subunit E/Vma4